MASSRVYWCRLHWYARYVRFFRTFWDLSDVKIMIVTYKWLHEVLLKFYKTLFISTLFVSLIRRLIKNLHVLTPEAGWKDLTTWAGMVVTFLFGNSWLFLWEELTDAW